MGLQLNKALTRTDGSTIPTGSVASYSTKFHAGSNKITFQPVNVHLSVADRDDYYNEVADANVPTPSGKIKDMSHVYEYTMTDQEKSDLETNTGAFSTVEGWLKDQIVANSNGYLVAGDIAVI